MVVLVLRAPNFDYKIEPFAPLRLDVESDVVVSDSAAGEIRAASFAVVVLVEHFYVVDIASKLSAVNVCADRPQEAAALFRVVHEQKSEN